MRLFCPIRGELNVEEKARDGITFTEEYRRIELVKILLNLGYQKEFFDFEVNVWDVGNSGRNHIRADLVIYDNLQEKKIVIIAEVKRNNKDKQDAIEQQLKPSCIRQQANYGIYYDGVENVFFTNQDNYTKEYSLLKFPISGFNFEDKPLKFDDLQTIENINEIIEKINQLLHNVATTKEVRYRELFKIIKAKYFDERENKDTENILQFQSSNNTTQNIKNLYNEAKEYYGDNQREKIELDDEVICKIVSLLQSYSFINSKQDILQTLFMKFAQSTLRIELDQFYTPIDITEFITSLIKITNTSKIIDPAGGSADFLVSCLKKNINCKDSIYYWDKDSNAYEVAKLNMILNGDGRTKMKTRDTIKDYNVSNNTMDFVITNPPFGNKTIYEANDGTLEHYTLYTDYNYKQLGVLYIERCMNLLKENGTLLIVIPYGFLTNPDDIGIRDYLLNNFRVIAFISMPEGAFSQSGTGVKTGILIVKKEQISTNYNIFVDVATDIGFDYTKKNAEKLYQRDNNSGEYILDNDNKKIPLSDLPNIANRFKKFAYDNQLTKYENKDNNEVYNYITKDEVSLTHTHTIVPTIKQISYLNVVDKIKTNGYSTLKDCEITNELSFQKVLSQQYSYIDISNLEKGSYLLENKLYGWELPNRAKQSVKKYDIIISKLAGSLDKFAMILQDNTDDIVATNGCYRIRIEDEKIRLSFYKFLFSKEYKIQMEALATGSIMLDVKKYDLKNNLYFPLLNDIELENMKEFVKQQEYFAKLRNNL